MSTTSKVFAGLSLAALLGAVYLSLGLLNTYKVYGESVSAKQKQITGLTDEIKNIRLSEEEANPGIGLLSVNLRRLQQTKGGGVWFGVAKLQGPNENGEVQLGISPLFRPAAEGMVFNPFVKEGDAPPQQAPEAAAAEAPAEAAPSAEEAPADGQAAPPAGPAPVVPGFVRGTPFPQEIRQASVLYVFRDVVTDGKLSGYRYLGAFRVKQVNGAPATSVTVIPEEGFGPDANVTDANNNAIDEVQYATQEAQAIAACDPNSVVLTVMSGLPLDDRGAFAQSSVESLKRMGLSEALASEYVADGKPAPADTPPDRLAKKWVLTKEFKRPNAPADEPAIAEGTELLLTEAEVQRFFGGNPGEYANALPEGLYHRPLFDFSYTLPELRRLRTELVIELERVVLYRNLAAQTVATTQKVLAARKEQKGRLDSDLAGLQSEVEMLNKFLKSKTQELASLNENIAAIEARLGGAAPGPKPDAAPVPSLEEDNSAALSRVIR